MNTKEQKQIVTDYHCQIVSARMITDPVVGECLCPENPHQRTTRPLTVEARNITDASNKAGQIIKAWDGLWLLDGLPVKRGSQIGPMIG